MSLLDILLVFLIISAISLFIYLIIWLNKVGKVINSLSYDIKDLHDKSVPLIDNLTKTAESASNLSTKAEEYVDTFSEIAGAVSEKFSWLQKKTGNSNQKKKFPGEELFVNLRAISKGIIAFIKSL